MKSLVRHTWIPFLLALPTAPLGAGGSPADKGTRKPPAPAPGAVEVRFTDDSILKLTLREDRVELKTPYGKLLVPVADIRHIEFATRLSPDVARRVRIAVANLGSTEFRLREEATAELLALREKAYPALLEATRGKDLEVARRASDLLEKVREVVPEDHLEIRKADVLQTDDSRISGHIEAAEWRADTVQFGEVRLKISDIRTLRSLASGGDDDFGPVLPDPGNLTGLQQQVGKRFAFKVTGIANGAIYGTDVYTTDSLLATAAVHAGILKPGQTGVVRVKIVAPPPAFLGSTRNGISSAAYGSYPAAYQVLP